MQNRLSVSGARIKSARHQYLLHQGAVTMPVPRSLGVTLGPNTSVRACVSRLATTRFAAGLTTPDCFSDSHHNAATPATWGQAMLVPLRLRKPPPTLAARMLTPGSATWLRHFQLVAGPLAQPSDRHDAFSRGYIIDPAQPACCAPTPAN